MKQIAALFDSHAPQKSASGIQALPHDNRIYVKEWHGGILTGWITTELYHRWWIGPVTYTKEWSYLDFGEFMMEAYSLDVKGSFWVWWAGLPAAQQKIYMEAFIAAHGPMIRKELDEHYAKYSEHRL